MGSSPIRVAYAPGAFAGMAELADAQDLKSCGTNLPYRFDSGCRQILRISYICERFSFFIPAGSEPGGRVPGCLYVKHFCAAYHIGMKQEKSQSMIEISLCMIVKNEEETLGRCLESMEGLVDEIVIVDTGSSDRTREVAGRYTEKLYHYVWRDDFSAARNFAFDKAGKAYCMWLDADDVMSLAGREEFQNMKRELTDSADMVLLPYHTGFDEMGRPSITYYRERIMRNAADFRFQGRVHEAVALSGSVVKGTAVIEHRKERKGDSFRNLRIYQDMEKRNEEFLPRDLYYYGRELVSHRLYEKGRQVLQAFLRDREGWKENKIDAARQLAVCCYGLGQEEEALLALLQSFVYDMPRGEICCDLGRHFLDRGRYREAVFWYEQALGLKPERDSGAFIQEECYDFLPAISLCVCYDRLGEWDKAETYNRLAGSFRPDSPCYLQNLEYFKKLWRP